MISVFDSAIVFITNPEKMLIVVSFVCAGIAALVAWKRFNKPWLLYAHLAFIFSPLFYFAISINCNMGIVQSLLELCTLLFAKFIIYVLPPIMAGSFIIGWFLIPNLYRRIAKSFSCRLFSVLCRKTEIKAELFIIGKSAPAAFSIGKRVFISVGLFEILSKKELEAVFLHELYHAKSHSSWNKFSSFFVRIFSPVAMFSRAGIEKDEISADDFAIAIQGSSRHIESARRKML